MPAKVLKKHRITPQGSLYSIRSKRDTCSRFSARDSAELAQCRSGIGVSLQRGRGFRFFVAPPSSLKPSTCQSDVRYLH